MNGINKVILAGHLGRDPEVRTTKSGHTIVELRLATSEYAGRDENGPKFHTEWHRVTYWTEHADAIQSRYSKGSPVLIEGKIRSREYQTNTGEKRRAFDIKADRLSSLQKGSGAKPAAETVEPPEGADYDSNAHEGTAFWQDEPSDAKTPLTIRRQPSGN